MEILQIFFILLNKDFFFLSLKDNCLSQELTLKANWRKYSRYVAKSFPIFFGSPNFNFV